VSVKPDFFEGALNSPFVQQRKAGVPPQDIKPEVTDPLVNKIKGLDDAMFLNISEIKTVDVKKGKGLFETRRCASCGEVTFVNKLRVQPDGKIVCMGCSSYKE